MALSNSEAAALRELARRYADVAFLPEQETRKNRWIKLNALRPERPMVLIDQLPWNELNGEGELDCAVKDPYWSRVETWMRRELYKWKHFPADMVVDPYVKLPRPFHSTGWGLQPKVTHLRLDATGEVDSQSMENLIRDPEDLEKIRMPEISVDEEEIRGIAETADGLFDGILPWKFTGEVMHLGAWDTIAYWMGVENCYIELMDRPEMMHALMERMTRGYLSQIEQMNRLRMFDGAEHYCHCSHTYRDDDPAEPSGTSDQAWAFGLAQLFTSVSPAITAEFECAYMKRVFPRFKHIYYGCCDRLDDRIELVAALPNVRKLSCSPWSHREAFAEKLPAGIIMSNKPTPALLAPDHFDEDAVRADLRRTMDAAKRYGKPLELILKDVSTVRYQRERLTRWSRIALEEAER